MTTTKAIVKFIILTLLLAPLSSIAAAGVPMSTKYPPYPDVWGYDLSDYPTTRNEQILVQGYKMASGDYWFEVMRAKEINNQKIGNYGKDKCNLIKFFEGSTEKFSDEGHEKLINIMDNSNRLLSEYELSKITFSNGDTLEHENTTPRATLCHIDNIRGRHFIKRDKNGKELGRYSIIFARPKLETVKDFNQSEECSVPSKDDKIHQQLYSFSEGMVKLEDDTFIIYDSSSAIVRFDQNLNTKFRPKVSYKTKDGRTLNYNLFVVPFNFIDELGKSLYKANKPVSQGLQDGIMDYILKNLNGDSVGGSDNDDHQKYENKPAESYLGASEEPLGGIIFGGNKMDLSNGTPIQQKYKINLFLDILKNAKNKSGEKILTDAEYRKIEANKDMTKPGIEPEVVFGGLMSKINAAFLSEYGRKKIDEAGDFPWSIWAQKR